MTAELLMLIGGTTAFLLTIYWVRSQDLLERYAVGWMGMAFLLLFCGLFPKAIESMANASRLSYPAAVLFVALAAMYVYSFSVSISLTRQYRHTVRLTQEIGILGHRLRELEARGADNGARGE
jgi:purine-cytosine permease-like protein